MAEFKHKIDDVIEHVFFPGKYIITEKSTTEIAGGLVQKKYTVKHKKKRKGAAMSFIMNEWEIKAIEKEGS